MRNTLKLKEEFNSALSFINTRRVGLFTVYKMNFKDEYIVTPFSNCEYVEIDQNIGEMTILDKFKTVNVQMEKINFNTIKIRNFLINDKNEIVDSKQAYYNFLFREDDEGIGIDNLSEMIHYISIKFIIDFNKVDKYVRNKKNQELFVSYFLEIDKNDNMFSDFCRFLNVEIKKEMNMTWKDKIKKYMEEF